MPVVPRGENQQPEVEDDAAEDGEGLSEGPEARRAEAGAGEVAGEEQARSRAAPLQNSDLTAIYRARRNRAAPLNYQFYFRKFK